MSRYDSSNALETTVTTFDDYSSKHRGRKRADSSFLNFKHLEVSPDFGNKLPQQD